MNNPILIYQTKEGTPKIEVILQNESVWVTQNQLSELFGTQRPAITKHLKISLITKNWMKSQHVPFWNVLQTMGKNIKQNFIILMQLSL